MEFTWTISSQNQRTVDSKVKNSWQEVLRFLRFAESRHHEVPKAVERLESIGLRGSMTLLEGVNTGSASVTVSLPYSEYSKIEPIVVQIMVRSEAGPFATNFVVFNFNFYANPSGFGKFNVRS